MPVLCEWSWEAGSWGSLPAIESAWVPLRQLPGWELAWSWLRAAGRSEVGREGDAARGVGV